MDKFLKSTLFYVLLGFMQCAWACQSEQPKRVADQPRPTSTKPATEIPTSMPEPMFVQEGVLEFHQANGSKKLLRLDIEIAHEGNERAQGLMWRKKMDEKQAMLFVFEQEEMQSFWMRNTYIMLDLIFVNENFEVVTVLKNVPVLNDTPRPSDKPAKYVIEVNAGVADKYNIVPGTKAAWQDFVNDQLLGNFPVNPY
ncbi:MAG: hypothetical protein RIR11_2305 [Bacteroidota bacterium]|jgi:uncharacterized membrane protein (UPF0127 family)